MDDGSALPCRGLRAWLDAADIPKGVSADLEGYANEPRSQSIYRCQSIDVSYFAQTPDGHKA
jgi:hypothetical protein